MIETLVNVNPATTQERREGLLRQAPPFGRCRDFSSSKVDPYNLRDGSCFSSILPYD
jgi:hypothetical protein